MELKIYNGEYFHRSKVRYVVFLLILCAVILVSLLDGNYFGAIILFLIVGGYFFFLSQTNKLIKLHIDESSLSIGEKRYARKDIQGFVLEMDTNTKLLKNIVFLFPTRHEIYTLKDTNEYIEKAVNTISQHIPLAETYDQSFFETMMRKMKL